MKEKYKKFFESIHDKYLFKCVFMAGGPGSGKSIVSQMMFGVDKNDYISPFGIKIINSDKFFERLLLKSNLPLIINTKEKDTYKRQSELRNFAKQLASSQIGNYINSMLPIIIDGTGREYNKIKGQAEALQNIGYDISMVFINTSLEVALERNANRDRVVDEHLVMEMWKMVQQNIGKFQSLFRSNFIIIDNNNYYKDGSPQSRKFSDVLFKKGMKLIQEPLRNHIAISIIDKLTKVNGLYLSDLDKVIEQIKI